MSEQLKRHYHGCEVVSTETGRGMVYADAEGTRVVEDGWEHIVTCEGVVVARTTTLAAAIQAAKAYTPPGDETDTDIETEEDNG
jgi:hypothetical protein